ncbi:hypothetical protein [uncultured Bacteroides sp.]|jgi:hypothetical protein|uniref:hypothetical protein n=1 Tax=uncultured Bacteroides sp. TaxID=162156 RepID=UPI00205E604C|nr:hypothetical protein [uncultured Bacteroides sp.]DAO06494.1 MAG TPA: hypothetical protein [Caudoviricetes sp.]
MVKKISNTNYLRDVSVDPVAVNERNRKYIDRFVSENYNGLVTKFSHLDGMINSSAFGALDKLNSTIISLYTDPNLHFTDWEQAKQYLSSKFTEKAIRVPVKKPIKSETEESEEELINL